jgi:PAP2 superfamily
MVNSHVSRRSLGGFRFLLATAFAKRPTVWIDALVVVWLLWLYDAVDAAAPLRERLALNHGWDVLRLEHSLRFTPELALNHWLAPHHLFSLLFSDYYNVAHFAVTIGLLMWLWWRRYDLYRPLRNTLVLINVIGLIVYWAFPVAPPRMLAGAGFTDVVANAHVWGSAHAGTGALASQANQFAAMPSLHIAWAAWSAIALWQLFPRSRALPLALALTHLALTSMVVMATGNHYIIDIAAGLLTGMLAFALANVRVPLRRRSPVPSQPAYEFAALEPEAEATRA